MDSAYEMKSLLTHSDDQYDEQPSNKSIHGSSTTLIINEELNAGDDNGIEDRRELYDFHQAASEGDLSHIRKHFVHLIVTFKKRKMDKEYVDFAIAKKRDRMINGYTAHHIAARYNQVNVLQFLLEIGASVNMKDEEDENTALLLAIKYNSVEATNLLLQWQAKVDICNKYSQYPIHFAARRGNKALCESIVSKMKEGDINKQRDASWGTALHSAVLGTGNLEVVEFLIQEGADVEARNKEGEQPLHLASAEDNPDIIVLLAKGAICDAPEATRRQKQISFINSQTGEKDTALHIAARGGYRETVKTIISIGARVNMRTDTNQTPLHLAAIGGQVEVARYLVMNNAKVGFKDSDQMTPLHKACQFGHVDIVKILIDRGAKLNEKDRRGFTPLMCAVWKGHNDVIIFLFNHPKLNALELIGINDEDCQSVLHLAVKENNHETAELLLASIGKQLIEDADKKNNSEDYKSCLHYAAEEGNEKMLVLLLKHGAKIDIYDIDDKTPLHRASENGNLSCVKWLAKEAPGIINATDAKGMSALHLATMNGHYKLVEELIKRGAEISSRDEWNWTPLDHAVHHGYTITVRVLIENEAKIDTKDTNGTTPLHHAALNGHAQCVKILLDHNANVSALNNDGKSCFDIAVENYQRDVCMAFITHKRWKEMLKPIPYYQFYSNLTSEKYQGPIKGYEQPMKKLIMFAPEIAELVLDKCIEQKEIEDENSKMEYTTTYDIQYLDIPYSDQDRENPYFGPSLMVKYNQNNLLQHPVTVKLINAKWAKMGRLLYLSSLMTYLLFVTLLTTMVVSGKKVNQERQNKTIDSTFCTMHKTHNILPWFVFAATVFQMLKEMAQAFLLRLKYIKDVVNWFEFLLYTSTLFYLMPFVMCQIGRFPSEKYLYNLQWTAGAISILLAWFNLLLYLKRAPFFGLYVIMFTEVLSTLLMVLSVFSILIFGFALAFHALFKLPEKLAAEEDGVSAFNHVGTGIVKTMVMMIGELDYRATFTDRLYEEKIKFLPYLEMGYFVFLLFVVIVTIVVMNLLVGLAIGDIESVRNNAYIRMLRSQVYFIGILQRTYLVFPRLSYFPRFNYMLESWYDVTEDDMTDYPAKYNNSWKRLTDWIVSLDAESLKKDQREMTSREQKLLEEIENQQIQLDKQKKTIRKIMGTLEKQSEIMKKIVEYVEDLPQEEHEKEHSENRTAWKSVFQQIKKTGD